MMTTMGVHVHLTIDHMMTTMGVHVHLTIDHMMTTMGVHVHLTRPYDDHYGCTCAPD